MQIVLVLCLVAGAFASCPANSYYDACGTACPVTCENHLNPPKFCILMCNPGCHCEEGYVKTKEGLCVKPEECPSDVGCGENQEYQECGTSCPLTCDNYDNPPKICNLMCNRGCFCQEGYVKTKDGRCVRPENCPPRAEVNSCLMESDGGMCRGYFPMFYYDAKSGQCEEFIYGGCGGNGNRFATESECYDKCSSVRVWESASGACDQPIERGRCLGFSQRYAFDKELGACRQFVYGGCGGNANNFATLAECQSTCSAHRVATACQQEKVVGPCRAMKPRFFYNQETGECEHFIYGGCGGNSNNFRSKGECEDVCKA